MASTQQPLQGTVASRQQCINSPIRAYLPIGSTTLTLLVNETPPLDTDIRCPMGSVLHHNHLKNPRQGVAIAPNSIIPKPQSLKFAVALC